MLAIQRWQLDIRKAAMIRFFGKGEKKFSSPMCFHSLPPETADQVFNDLYQTVICCMYKVTLVKNSLNLWIFRDVDFVKILVTPVF